MLSLSACIALSIVVTAMPCRLKFQLALNVKIHLVEPLGSSRLFTVHIETDQRALFVGLHVRIDHVSMGANAATKLYKVMDNLEHILAIELMNAAQGIDFRRPLKTSPVLERFLHAYRKEVPFVKDDIVMYKEIHKTVAFLKRTQIEY